MDVTLQGALQLRALGFAVHWLRPASKAPINPGWSEAAVMDADQLIATYRQGYNVGFRPGKWSVVDGCEICVLDVDVRGGEQFFGEVEAVAKSLLRASYRPTVRTGSGGQHQFLRFPPGQSPAKAATLLRQSDVWVRDGQPCVAGTHGAKRAWQVELLSTGKNVVLPPSIHPDTHRPYIWLEDFQS